MPREIAGAVAPAPPIEDGLVEGLPPWLAKLDAVAHEGRFQVVEVGLAKWDAAAQGYLEHDGKISGALAALVNRRDELTGRVRARRAQAQARQGRGAAQDPRIDELAREAEKLLARRPTPLAQAAALVERYEEALRTGL
jgi:hypothetical protein